MPTQNPTPNPTSDIERNDIDFISRSLNCLPVAHVDSFTPDKLGTAELCNEVPIEALGLQPCARVHAVSQPQNSPHLPSPPLPLPSPHLRSNAVPDHNTMTLTLTFNSALYGTLPCHLKVTMPGGTQRVVKVTGVANPGRTCTGIRYPPHQRLSAGAYSASC